MQRELPPYVSMVDILEDDYNAKYEAWRRKFYEDNMTDNPPITLGQICAMLYEKHMKPKENDAIKFLGIAAIIILVIFWIIPAIAYHDYPSQLDKLGTFEVVSDIIAGKGITSGVYVTEFDGTRRKLSDAEVNDFINKNQTNPGEWEYVKKDGIYYLKDADGNLREVK